MAVDHKAIASVITLIVKAVNASTNPLGQGGGISRLADYGSLLPDVIGLVSNIGDLPKEVKDLGVDDIQIIVDQIVTEINVPNAHAQAIVTASLATFDAVMSSVVKKAEELADVIKGEVAK